MIDLPLYLLTCTEAVFLYIPNVGTILPHAKELMVAPIMDF